MGEPGEIPSVLGQTRGNLKRFFTGRSKPRFHGDQVFEWIWHRGIIRPEDMTDLPLGLRQELKTCFDWETPIVEKKLVDSDGTVKFVLRLRDRVKIESVLIPRPDFLSTSGAPKIRKGIKRTDCTLCVSTQVGCRFRCVFCRSGRDGLNRNLQAGEIAGQLFSIREQLAADVTVRSIVLMGIGEPLDNYENVSRAIKVWLDNGSNVYTGGRIIVSTIGLPHAIRLLSADLGGRISLALSLHSPFAEKRKKIVPAAGPETPQEILDAACRFDFPSREKLTVEYVMVHKLNDSARDAEALAAMLRGKKCIVNLIPLNPAGAKRFKPPPDEKIELFQALLAREGIMTFIRRRRGGSIRAACGQLAFSRE